MHSRVPRWLIGAVMAALCLSGFSYSAVRAQAARMDPSLAAGSAGEPGPFPDPAVADDVSPQGTLSVEPGKPINYQGFVTDALGAPLQGPHNFTVYLYNAATGGSIQFGREDHLAVKVVNGHFLLAIGAGTLGAPNVPLSTDVFDVDLWLEVWVDGSALPRQPLRAVPWAYGLVPGAKVWGDPTDFYALRVLHTGTGATDRGIYAYGYQYGLVAEEVGPGSDAIYSGNYVNAQGYRSRSDSYVWVPGMECKPVTPTDGVVTLSGAANGGARLSCLEAGQTLFQVPLVLPGVLLGQDVTVEQVTVYYRSSNSANAYINATALFKITGADTNVGLITDYTKRSSTIAASYSLTPTSGNVLGSASGPLTLALDCHFENLTDHVQLGMVRVRLGHTETP